MWHEFILNSKCPINILYVKAVVTQRQSDFNVLLKSSHQANSASPGWPAKFWKKMKYNPRIFQGFFMKTQVQ